MNRTIILKMKFQKPYKEFGAKNEINFDNIEGLKIFKTFNQKLKQVPITFSRELLQG